MYVVKIDIAYVKKINKKLKISLAQNKIKIKKIEKLKSINERTFDNFV